MNDEKRIWTFDDIYDYVLEPDEQNIDAKEFLKRLKRKWVPYDEIYLYI